ncbi:MAG TPA: serine/threonine-protein kinase [Thermoanaerobaculia bacterium]|nr:serine/threonine-protein kinase [Thermoanaerobaculia bacterium]
MTTPAPDAEKTARMESGSPRPSRQRGMEAQFAPGTIIAGRYRIASILGSGGMGEVYRADDTKLGQQVALKFLPQRLARDPLLLERLHDEVRLGRQIAHPNVCRIYDIVDWDDAHFVAMEYVDGEDLSRLLHRIGRLASDKAVDIARGIAAGLAAAHAKGIFHRDLKPANVMIDSHGDARIMDFGLALAAGDDSQDGVISGTPAYMAPEQLAGEPASVQSDLYALGLVMYELVTGKRAHNARTLPERVRDLTSEITTPSNVIRDVDPAVERIILRCLANEPSQRPRSAREVIEALPGGDPLAMALAAGETPSPRLVAAAGTEGTLRPAVALSLLGAIVLLIAIAIFCGYKGDYFGATGFTRPPEVQAERAAGMLRHLGIPQQKHDASGFRENTDYDVWISKQNQSWQRVRRGLPLTTFWLREEPEPLFRPDDHPQLSLDAPPLGKPGSAAIEIDSRGRLISLRAVAEPSWPARILDWSALLESAGLRQAALTPTAPQLLPPSYADARMAWSGTHPEDGTPIRVEAAALRGVPVFFRVLGPWDQSAQGDPSFGPMFTLYFGLFLTLIASAGVLLAWRNLRQRRGDRAGAFRIAIAFFVLLLIAILGFSEHEPSMLHELRVLGRALESSLLGTATVYLAYIALEPYLRRRSPERLVAWARLLAGNWRDPMVGRDVLIGLTAGVAQAAGSVLSGVVRQWVKNGDWIASGSLEVRLLDRSHFWLPHVASALTTALVLGMNYMILLMLLTMLLRRRALAAAGFFAIMMTLFGLAAGLSTLQLPWLAANCIMITFVLVRYGLLATIMLQFGFFTLFFFPQPAPLGWYTARALIPIVIVLAIAVWAARTSVGDQKLFATDALDA